MSYVCNPYLIPMPFQSREIGMRLESDWYGIGIRLESLMRHRELLEFKYPSRLYNKQD